MLRLAPADRLTLQGLVIPKPLEQKHCLTQVIRTLSFRNRQISAEVSRCRVDDFHVVYNGFSSLRLVLLHGRDSLKGDSKNGNQSMFNSTCFLNSQLFVPLVSWPFLSPSLPLTSRRD